MKRFIILRVSSTEYGKKGHFRLYKFNVNFHIGAPPWASRWKSPWHLRRITYGWKVAARILPYAAQLRFEWHDFEKAGKKKRPDLLMCPRCKWTNKPRNFYRRSSEDTSIDRWGTETDQTPPDAPTRA